MIKVSDVRVHKSTFNISTRLSRDKRELVIDSGINQTERYQINKEHIWISFYIKFGSAVITLETQNTSFSTNCGENIILSNNNSKANLINENPAAVCYVDKPLFCGDALTMNIGPISDHTKSKTSSLPRRYYVKIGIYQNKTELIKNAHFSSFNVVKQSEQNCWKPLATLEKTECEGSFQVGISAAGQFVFSSESGKNGKIQIPNMDYQIGTFCVFELFRVRIKLLNLEKIQTYDYPINTGVSEHDCKGDNRLIPENCSLFSETDLKTTSSVIPTQLESVDQTTTPKQMINSHMDETDRKMDNHALGNSVTSETTQPINHNNINITKINNMSSDREDVDEISNSFSQYDARFETRDSNVTSNEGYEPAQNSPSDQQCMNIPVPSNREGINKHEYFPAIPFRNNSSFSDEIIELRNENVELKTRITMLEEENKTLKLENEQLQNMCCINNRKSPTLDSVDPPQTPTSPNNHLSVLIQAHFVQFVSDLDLPDLCDHLYQQCQITLHDLEYLQQLVKYNKREANRHFLTLIRKRAIECDVLEASLLATKQEALVQLLRITV